MRAGRDEPVDPIYQYRVAGAPGDARAAHQAPLCGCDWFGRGIAWLPGGRRPAPHASWARRSAPGRTLEPENVKRPSRRVARRWTPWRAKQAVTAARSRRSSVGEGTCERTGRELVLVAARLAAPQLAAASAAMTIKQSTAAGCSPCVRDRAQVAVSRVGSLGSLVIGRARAARSRACTAASRRGRGGASRRPRTHRRRA